MASKIYHVPVPMGRPYAWQILNDPHTPWPGVSAITLLHGHSIGEGSQHRIDFASAHEPIVIETCEFDERECVRTERIVSGKYSGWEAQLVLAPGPHDISILSLRIDGPPRLILCIVPQSRITGAISSVFAADHQPA